MNGQTIPSVESDVIVSDGENIRYGEKKKLSLTLPLLNVIVTNAVNEEGQDDTTVAVKQKAAGEKMAANDSVKLEVTGVDGGSGSTSSGESSKMKKIYESDDTFIQAIFSQTIKSTTATPTDDEPSQDFGEAFKQSSTKTSQDDNDAETDTVAIATSDKIEHVPTDDQSESTSKEPAAIYTYFHQTIEEDDSPDDLDKTTIDLDLDVNDTSGAAATAAAVTSNPIPILTTTIYTHTMDDDNKTQINICTEVKETEFSDEKDCGGGGASCDNSLNNTSTAFASNEAISEQSEHSLTQLNSLESDQSDSQNGDEQIIVTTEKTSIEKSGHKKKSSSGDHSDSTKNGTEKKKKSKKSKKSTNDEKENISVRSSFSKFDALQKQNMKNGSTEGDKTCRSCGKIVYKMEEIKAEKSVWHKNKCFKCSQCSKPLSVDTFESHEGVLYCKLHFKSLFSPKAVEDSEPEEPRKPELIIRESQPVELPPDVVRSSDKNDLGLSELHQLNVKERYNIFEHAKKDEPHHMLDREERVLKRGNTVLSKLAKFKAKGMDVGDAEANLAADDKSDDDEAHNEDGEDIDLIRAREAQIERPICTVNMDDIKSKFESGHSQSREERREERKQEIQSIRSRLFMGKQAKIKEMYQQAVADSEQCVRASNKKPDVDIGDKARSIKSKFENGEVFKDEQSHLNQIDDSAVFEHGLGKQSRSIFMEIDAKASASPQHTPSSPGPTSSAKRINPVWPPEQKENTNGADVVKYDEKIDEVKIKTADISNKFKFFETYKPESKEKRPFRMTPPRDGVVPQNNNDDNDDDDAAAAETPANVNNMYVDVSHNAAQRSSTTTKMLSVFRQMEEDVRGNRNNQGGMKPLKCFTPPPDDGRRMIDSRNSRSGSEYSDSEGESGDEDNESDSDDDNNQRPMDEALQQAQAAARAKQLRAKFEKWEQKEIKREQDQLYDGEDQSQIDTRCIRAKFESLRNAPSSPSREKIQVNRFVVN
ncbi:uncharacterized protein LOC129574936 isoform X3 [Sitodiplosis mosellana]|uniref:uncharacterized protein LOC129574936 isoform X3 n=1 Tax=Sitodiplosis mosellana TaxID=263140 RepID=UPI0024448942|nr:uncharacterized protein LOC129574936 isoform X3 [Sitodiplosis mosellana]